VFPGTGIQENLADKAKRLGIPVWRFADGGAYDGMLMTLDRVESEKLADWMTIYRRGAVIQHLDIFQMSKGSL
jgi:hypothetical protein